MLNFSFLRIMTIFMPFLVALWISAPNFNYSNVEMINDAVLTDGEAEPVQEVRKNLPFWPNWLPNKLINLGLDLRGGAQVLVEVILEESYSENITGYWGDIRKVLRSQRENIGSFRRIGQFGENLTLEFESFEKASKAEQLLTLKIYPVSDLSILKPEYIEVLRSGKSITIELSKIQKESINKLTMAKSLEIIRRRVDEAGTREPSIQRQGDSRILVQVPGMGSAEELLQLIGQTARLTFHKVLGQKTKSEPQLDLDQITLPDESGDNYFILEQVPVVSGESLTNAQPSFDQNNRPAVSFQFNPTAGRKFGDYTKSNIGEPFAIVLDGVVISAPVIQSHIPGGTGIITGSFSVDESNRLAILLRAGALPAGISVLEQRTVGPELGADSIQSGKVAAFVGGVFVLLFMIFTYRTFGLFANLALMINMVFIVAVLTTIGATLTLPGIAGIVLTIGMAVDANVIIFERIKEEIRRKKNTFDAVKNGYEMALSSIIDANVTTFIAAVVLFCFGSGPIKGFSITLGVGILTSVFTAIYVTRLFILMYLNWFKPKTFLV